MPVSKEEVLSRGSAMIASKKQTLLQAFRLLEESLATESKSSVGDKHETDRARMQEEQGKLLKMLNEILETEGALIQLSQLPSGAPQKGTMVSTSNGLFFLGLSLGRMEINGETVYAISAASPLGDALKDRKAGDTFDFRDVRYRVLEVW